MSGTICAELLKELVPELPWCANPHPLRMFTDASVPDLGVHVVLTPDGALVIWVASVHEMLVLTAEKRHQIPVRLDEQLYRLRGYPAVDALHNRVAGRELAILIGKEAP